MTTATSHHTTTRRDAMRGTAFAGLAGILSATTATTARAAPRASDNPDAALIAACARLITHHACIDALVATRHTIADEQRTEPELTRLFDRQLQIESEFDDFPPPETFKGVVAMARVLVTCGPKNSAGELVGEGFDMWVGLSIAEFLAGNPA